MEEEPGQERAREQLIEEALRHAEARLESQIRLVSAAEHRAATLSGIYITAAVGLIAVIIGAVSTDNADFPIWIAGSSSVILLLVGAAYCVLASLPKKFHVAGNDPANWNDDIQALKTLAQARLEILDYLQECVTENRATLKEAASLYKIGAILGISSPFFGSVVWILLQYGGVLRSNVVSLVCR